MTFSIIRKRQKCRRQAYVVVCILLIVFTISDFLGQKHDLMDKYKTRNLLQTTENENEKTNNVEKLKTTKQKEIKSMKSKPTTKTSTTVPTTTTTTTTSTRTATTTTATTSAPSSSKKPTPKPVAVDASQHENHNHTCELPSVSEFPGDLFSQSQRIHGAFIVHLFIAIYMFPGLAIVCDYYFVPSLEVICHRLKLQADVAGASFMAVGSSAPELFASIIGVFITKGDIGIGTILGSAVFNVLFVLGLCAVLSTMELNLSWWPVTRDTLCYATTLLLLAIVIFDGLVTWKEAAIMLLVYGGYLALMWFNERIEKKFYLYIGDTKTYAARFETLDVAHYQTLGQDDPKEDINQLTYESDNESNSEDSEEDAYPTDPPKELCDIPSSVLGKIRWFLTLPINSIFFVTIPDIRRRRFRGYVTLTFFMSIIWIGFLTYVLVWMVAIIGFTINIPETVMGLTFIAFGSSVPDAFASILVARQGKGDMAIAQALGSNVFDILFGLGLPWLLKTLIFDMDSTIEVQSAGMLVSCFIIFILILLTLGALYYQDYKLTKNLGVGMLVAYGLFLFISVLMELYVWNKYQLPTCNIT